MASRRNWIAIVGILVLGSAVLAVPQLLGLSRVTPYAQLIALRPLLALAAVALAIWFVVIAVRVRGSRGIASGVAGVMLLFAVTNVAILGARGWAPVATTDLQSSHLVVLSWNTQGDRPSAEDIAAIVVDEGADVVALPETSNDLGQQVALLTAASGRPMQVLTATLKADDATKATTLLISTQLGGYQIDLGAPTTEYLASLVARSITGSSPTIVAAHTLAPIPPMVSAWEDDLRWAADQCSGADSQTIGVILVGDFNATLDHFAGLPRAEGATLGNCTDAAAAAGSAGLGTWPTMLPPVLGAPIDHVLATSAFRPLDVRPITSHDLDGSDHRPLVAHYAWR